MCVEGAFSIVSGSEDFSGRGATVGVCGSVDGVDVEDDGF